MKLFYKLLAIMTVGTVCNASGQLLVEDFNYTAGQDLATTGNWSLIGTNNTINNNVVLPG